MLKFVRKGAKSLLGTLMLGAISLVFVFSFGPGANGCQSVNPNQNVADYVVMFNGKKILIGEYQEVRKSIYQQQQKRSLSESELNTEIIQRLVNEQVLLAFANKLNLVVSDNEKDEYIKSLPYFQVNGEFNYEQYRNVVLNGLNTTPEQYEKNTKKNILIQKAMTILSSSISVTDKELWEKYELNEKKLDISFMAFEIKKEALKNPTPEEVTAYLTSNEADVKKYFADNKDEFTHAKEVEASHILLKTKGKKEADLKAKLEKIAKEHKGGADFAELAKKHSEGPSSTTGGKLNYFTKDKMVKEFSEAAFKLKVNEVSTPVKTVFGYHLIKVTGIKEAKSDKFEDVKTKIATKLLKKSKKEKAVAEMKSSLKENLAKAKTLTDLSKLMPETKVTIQKDMTRNSIYIPELGVAKDLVEDIFKETVKLNNILPKTYEVEGKLVLVEVNKVNLDKEKFEKEKSKLRETAVQLDKNLFIDAWLNKQKKDANIKVHPTYLTN